MEERKIIVINWNTYIERGRIEMKYEDERDVERAFIRFKGLIKRNVLFANLVIEREGSKPMEIFKFEQL